jgi:hypothetical protein
MIICLIQFALRSGRRFAAQSGQTTSASILGVCASAEGGRCGSVLQCDRLWAKS